MTELPLNVPVVDESGREIVRPDVVQFIMQATATAQLVKLRKLEESRVPIGSMSVDLTVTDAGEKLFLSPPWISFTLVNDGPDAVRVEFNDPTLSMEAGAVALDESVTFDAVYAVIEQIALLCAAGETAAVRIKAKVGRPLPSTV